MHILFEPVDADMPKNPIELLKEIVASRGEAVLVTIFSVGGLLQTGTSIVFSRGNLFFASIDILHEPVTADILSTFSQKKSCFKTYESTAGTSTAFIEFLPAPLVLVIAGAGNDVQPLVELTAMLGWTVTVIDGRPGHSIRSRFPSAENVLVRKTGNLLSDLDTGAGTAFLLMTHNYNYDLAFLKELARTEFAFIGMLGPAQKRDRMLRDLEHSGIKMTDAQLEKIYGPVGLDIGAETATEIAFSIVAELQASFSHRPGSSLRLKADPIHARLVYDENNE